MAKKITKKFNVNISLKMSLTLVLTSALIALIYFKTDIFNYLSKHHIYKQKITNKIDNKDLTNLSNFKFIQNQPYVSYDSDYTKNKFGIVSLWLKYESKEGYIKNGKNYQFSIFHTNIDCETKKMNIDFMVNYFTKDLYPALVYDKPDDEYGKSDTNLELFCNK